MSFQLQAQKVVEKTLTANDIKTIIVDGHSIFRIKIETSNTKQIVLKTRSEGQYGVQNLLGAKRSNDTLFVSSKLQPFFKDSNNKYTAQKVIATDLTMSIPENLNITINSDIATTNLSGIYNNILIELVNGNCVLKSFLGNAVVNTINGYIDIETQNAKVEAYTKNGAITKTDFSIYKYMLNLNSIHGDIRIKKAEK